MNESLIIVGIAATMSLIFVGLLAYNIRSFITDRELLIVATSQDNSSLEEDFRDIMEFIPIREIQRIVEDYVKHDVQINETINFIKDQKKFIVPEFRKITEVVQFVNVLKENGLQVEVWDEMIHDIWNKLPPSQKAMPNTDSTGLTGMIRQILKIVPQNELHEFLRQKYKYSGSFRRFIEALKSEQFVNMCNAIEENRVLQRHFFWAKEAGLEATFAIELLRDLYIYLVNEIA